MSGTDDSVPTASLERITGSHERETVQQAGGGPTLQPQNVGRRHEVHDGHWLDVPGAGEAGHHRQGDEDLPGGPGDGQEVGQGAQVPQGEEGHLDPGLSSVGVCQKENGRKIIVV